MNTLYTRLKFLVLTLVCFLSLKVEGQFADFTTNPQHFNNTLNICGSSSVLFTVNTSSLGNNPSTLVQWTITTTSGSNTASVTTSTLKTPFPILFPQGQYSVTLTVTTPNNPTSTKTITVNSSAALSQTPSLSLNNANSPGWTTGVTTVSGNNTNTFTICPLNSDPQYIQWNLNGVTCNQISSISITDYTTSNAIDCSSGIIENTYNISPAVRFFYLVLNVGFTNGCNYSTVYFVQIGQPSVPITSSTVPACDPGNYALSFNNQAPGVTYTIDWDLNNPNNPTESYTYPNLPTFPSKVLHSYPFVSCSNGSAPSYDIQVTATNTCGFSTSQPADVYVSQAPDAIFNRTPNLDVICQGTQVTYTDNSFAGYYSNPNNGNCSQVYNRWWYHSNNTGSGPSVFPTTPNILLPSSVTSLGNSSTNGPQSFSVTYNQPGTYSIKLIVRSAACGNDTMTKTVCVVPAVQANFNPNLTTGCVPLTVLTTNNSSLPGCPGTNMLYNWSVSNAPATCGTPAWSFATGFNSNSSAPSINFTGPGQYTIKLVTSLNPSVPGAQCQNDTLTQTITVKDKPIVNIPSPSPICQGQFFTPTATVNDCYNPSSTYAWSFTNGSPATSTILNPGSVSYTNSGNFTYTLIATNSCGPTSVSNTITVNPIAIVNAGVNDTVCQGSSVTLNGLVSGGATGGTWQSTPTGGNFLPNANTLNASYIPSLGTTGNVVLSLTATGTISPCPSVSDDKIIVFNPKPTVSAGNDTTICAGSNVNLHGTIGGAATNSTWTTATPGSGSFSNANALNTTFTPSATAISAGGVDLILTTNDPVGPCGPTKDTVHVTINPIPSLTATNINTVCSGVTFNIPLTPSVLSPPASYAWNVNGTLPAGVTTTISGTISPPNSSLIGTVSNLSAGPVTINYSITTTVNGCTSAPISVNATINPLPQPLITPPGPTTVCNGNTLTLTTSVYSTYLWSNNATTQSTTINSAGNYTVTVTNSYGCTGTSPASVVNFSEPIQPTFTQVNAICFNGTFSLPSTSTNGITGTWSPAINTSATTVYTFTPSPGQCANTAQMTVTVNALPTPTITANGPLTFCQGSSVILTAAGGSSYVWNLNGSLIAGATSATYTATTAGSYTVTATNANGCQATSTITIVTVNPNPQPVINPIGPTAICQGTNLILSTASTYSSYNWYLGSSPNSLGTNDSLTVNSAGSYTVTVVNSNGCSGTSNASVVSITSPTVPTFAPIAAVCQNSNFTLPNSSINGVSGTWSPAINNQSTTVYTFTPNLGQCASNTTLQVVINPLPTVTINAVTICSGQSATLNAIPSITGGTYSWSGSSQTTASLTTTPLVNTIYTVIYTLNNCSATDTALVQVKTTPTLSVNNATICNGQTATLTATASPLGGVYSWSNSSNSSTISVNPSSNGSYTVNYALNGCSATAAVSQVTVNPVPTISTNNPTICQGQSVALTASVNLSGGTYLWSNNASTATITVSPNTSTNYTVVYTLNNCSSLPANTNVTVTPSPTISSPNTSICSGQSTTLNTTVSPPGGTYQWSPSVGLSSNTASNPTASPNATQLYTVVYTANGCASLPDTVIVSVIQGITASVNNATICNGSTAVLTALPNNATYLWSNGATTSSISISPNSSTSLTVTVSAPGCPSSTATSAVTVNAIPTLTLPSSTTICNGASASIATTVSAPGGTYLWSPSAQTTATLNIAPALTNNAVVQNFNYTVVYTLNGCPSLPDTATITVNPLPTVSLPASTALCNGSSTTLTPTVNIPGGTYLWTNGETTSTISVNPTANANYGLTYSLNGCSSSTGTSSGNIVVNPIPTVSVNNQTICAGQQASLTAVGTPANQGTYLWSTTESTASINVTPTATGTYTVTYTVNNCPSVPAIANVTVNPIPTITATSPISICGGLSTQINPTVTPSGGTYLWSANANNATTSQITVSPATTTTYTLVYTANNCSLSQDIQVQVIQNPIATVANQTICFGSSTTLVAGPNGASYLWSNGATTQTLTVSPTVTTPYSVTVNIGGCAATTATSTVTVNPIPTVSIPNNATICNGATASLATSVSAPGGTYLWSPSAQTTATLNIAPALTNNAVVQNFNYTVVYTLNGCPSLPDTATITVNPVPTVSLPTSTALCNGSSTTLTPTVNIPGGTYLWTNGETTSTISVNPTANANYGLTYSLNGCASSTGTSSGNIVVNPIPTVSVNNQTICAGQQASLTAVGTPANQGTYLWSTTASTASINVTPTATGTYTVTYTVNNCPSVPAIANVTVNPIPTITATSPISICGGLSTQINPTVTPSGGTYLWSANANNATTSQITVSPTTTTTYTLVYTANNCSLSQDIQVQVIQNPIATVANQTICFGSSTTLVAGPNGASYLWSNGATTQTLTVSPTVTTPYSVTVNIGGCAATTATSTVTVNPIPTVSIPNNATICNGATASLATSVSAPGGTYLWSPSAQTTATLNIAPALTNNAVVQNFNYTVVYTLNGCPSLPDTATITVNPVPTVSLPTSTALCNGSSTTLTPTVNIPGGTYLWTNGETTSTISVNPTANANYGLTYSLNGCSSSTGTSSGNIVVNPIPTVSVNNQTICAGQQASLTAVGTPANQGTYLWSTTESTASINVTPTATGTYTVTYTVNNCPSVPAIANVTVNPIPTLNIPDTTICGGLSVALSANPTPTGGTYLWSANANNATTSQVTVTPTVTTTYSLAYTANGCVANDNVTVSVIQNPIATVANQTICFGSSTTLVAGPNGASYLWSNGATTQTLTVSPTVTTPYSVTVNIGGCAATTATSTVTVNPIPTVSIPNNATICNGASASLATSVSAPGGTYLWSPSAQTTATLNIAPALTNNAVVQNFNYTVVYTLNGCPSLPDTATITVNPVPTVSLPTSTALCNGSSTTLTPTVNIPGGTYLWTNGETTSTISVNPTANANYGLTYSLNGCSSSTGTSSGNIVVNPIPTVSVNNQTICAGQQASLTAVGTPANQGTYLWSTTASTASINVTPTATGTYTVTYTVNNCPSVPAIANVTVNPIPTLNIPDTTICGGLSVALSANPTPTGGTYLWSANANNATTSQVTVTPAVTTTYSLAYTANGCVANDNVTVSVIQNPIATAANQTICFGSSTTLVAGPNGASYLWSTGATTQTLTVSPTVTTPYSVTVNIGGCAATTATSTVTVNPIPSVSVANVAAICNGSTTTLTATPSAPGGAYVWNNGATGAIINVSPSLTNPTSAQNFNYSVIYTLNGCPSLPDTVTVSVNPIPTASLPTTTTICNGSSDTLVPTVNPTGGTFSWSNGATTSSIVVNPTANTNYSVTYTLNGCPTTSSSTTGFVVVNPIPTVTIPTPAAICFGQQATLTATPSALGGSYLWSANTNNATSASINVSPTSTTTYSVVYTLNGCASAPTSVTVTVNTIPVITINDTTICGGLSVLLNPSVTPTGGTFAWSANANNATTSQVTVTPANTTIYTLVYTANGCIGTENIQVSVIQNPIATVENDTICFGSSTTLVAGPNGASYLWSTGATTQTLTVSPTVTSPYSVTVNIGGCAATTATSTVMVNPIPTVSIPNNATICNGVTASLATSVSAPGGTYLWSPSAQTTATLNIAPALTNNAVGQNFNYTVVYTLNGCPSLPDTATITVNPVPIINFNDTTICETQTASLVGIPNILGGNYTWSTAQTTQQINVSPSITTSYSLIYTINGCSDTTDQFVYVNPIPTIQINQNPTICYGSDTLLTTNVSIPSGTYAWSGYGLTGVNNQNQVNVSPQNGNSNQNSQFIYSVIYSVNGCSDTAFTTVSVNLIPTITASASQSTICPGESTVLTGIGIPTTSNGNQGVYSWTTTNPITNIGNSPSVTVNPIINTTYEVVYTLNSCPSVAFPVSITIQPAPALVIQNNPNATICEGGCVTLTALQNASSIVPSGYIWSTGETTQSIIVCPTDTMFYSVIGLSGTCESLPDTTFVNVVQDPIITTQIVLDTNICVGGAYTFNISVSGGVGLPTYQWFQNSNPTNFGGTAIPNATNSAYTTPVFNVQGAYFYYCVITYPNGVGCNAISTEVGSLYVLPDPTISITNGASQTLCIGGDADCLSTEVLGGVGTNTYLWIPGGAVTDSLCPPSNQVGTINYSVIVQQSGIACGSLPSNQVSITVIPDPIINIAGLTDVCEGAEVPLNTSVTGGIGSVADYQWYESNPTGQPYQVINGATSLNFTSPVLTSDASYVVEVNLTGVGCNDTDTFAINVYDDPLITIQGNLMACMNEQIDLTTVFTGGTPNSSNTYTWYSAINQNYPDSILLQSTSILNTYSFNIYQDTSIFVIVTNSGFNCDNDTSALINVDGIEWAEASFDMDPSDLSQSLLNPTFSFINTSLNSTNYFWDLGECDPQSPMSELFTPPTSFYDPTDKDQIGYTYGCPPGLYQIMMVAMNQGMCPDTAYQVIRIQDEILVYVPNTFTPDYDETNDFFFPVISTIIKPNTYYFSIYDRWGELIFESKDPNEKWDGTYYKNKLYQSGLITKQDEMAQDGTYNWKLRFTVKESGVDKEFSGHVNLLK